MADKETLEVVTHALLPVVASLVISSKINPTRFAALLQSFAESPDLEEDARSILLDLAGHLKLIRKGSGWARGC